MHLVWRDEMHNAHSTPTAKEGSMSSAYAHTSDLISRRRLMLAGGALAALHALPQAAAAQTASPLVTQLDNGAWPSEADARKLYEDLLTQRAVQSYMLTL